MDEFRRELVPFLATEISIPLDPIPFGTIEQIAMTPGEIAAIELFLPFEQAPPAPAPQP